MPKAILLNIKPHHMLTSILNPFATFEALAAACQALPSSCFLPVCNPGLCFVMREGFSVIFLLEKTHQKILGAQLGKLAGGLQWWQLFFLQAKPEQAGQQEAGTCTKALSKEKGGCRKI